VGRRHRMAHEIECFVPDPIVDWDPTLTASTAAPRPRGAVCRGAGRAGAPAAAPGGDGVLADREPGRRAGIGRSSFSPAGADFVPPPHEYVEELLDDLAAFLNVDDLPVTLQAAIAHAQFETIHPFLDGNGRTGRCLIHVVYRRRGLVRTVVPPISLVLAPTTASTSAASTPTASAT
jgi:hypothetical protein